VSLFVDFQKHSLSLQEYFDLSYLLGRLYGFIAFFGFPIESQKQLEIGYFIMKKKLAFTICSQQDCLRACVDRI